MATYKNRLYGTRLDKAIEELGVYVTEVDGKKVNDINNNYPKNQTKRLLDEGYKATTTKTQTKTSTSKKKKKKEEETWFSKGAFGDDKGNWVTDTVSTILGTTGDVLTGAAHGIGSTLEGVGDLLTYGVAGVADLFGADEFADFARKEASKDDMGEFFDKPENFLDKHSVLGEKSDAISQGLGQVGLLIASGGAASSGSVATAITSGLTFTSSMGSGMSEAYQSGATDGEATLYGAIKGTGDAVTELLFGGLGKAVNAVGLSKGISSIDDAVASKLSSKISNKIAKNITQWGIKAGFEGTEEVLAGAVSAAGKKLTYMSEEDIGKLLEDEQLLDQFIAGAVTSGVAQSGIVPGMKQGSLIESTKAGRDFITGYTQNEQTVIDSLVNEHTNTIAKQKAFENEIEKAITAKETEQGGKLSEKEKNALREQINSKIESGELDISSTKVSNKEISAIREIVEEEMQKGLLDTNKIESILGSSFTENDSYLQRSYIETARKSENFTYDDAKVTNKQEKAVYDSAAKYFNNTTRSHEFVEKVAKISKDKGTNYGFINNEELKSLGHDVEGKQVNGLVRTNQDGKQTVLINIDSPKALNTIVGHETTHLLEGTQEYKDLQEAIFNYAKEQGDFDARQKSLNSLYEGIENANVDAELTADLVGDYLFTDEQFINSLSTNKPTVFQKIKELIDDLVVRFTGTKEEKALREVQKKFKEAYRKNAQSTEGTQYAISEDTYNKVNNEKQLVHLTNNLSSILDSDSIKGDTFSVAVQNKGSRYIGYGQQAIKLKPEILNYVDETKLFKGDGATNHKFAKESTNKFSSLEELLNDNPKFYNEILFKGDIPLNVIEEVTIPKNSSSELINKLTDAGIKINYYNAAESYNTTKDVQYSLTDNQGRTLTKEQQEYFKDVSPELKDENGNIKVLYHGSNSKFTIFDPNKGGASNSKAGVGFWFTESGTGAKNFAESVWYGGRTPTTYEVYLNLKNPKVYEPIDTKAQKQELNKQLKEIHKEKNLLADEYAWETPSITQMAYYLEHYSENDVINSLTKKYGYKEEKAKNYVEETKKYKQLNKEYKRIEKEHDNLGYDDSYEQFRTDIYKVAGMSANDANIGGIGMAITNNDEVVKQYRDNLIKEGYDGIVIKNTSFDTDTLGAGNNQYVAFYPNQIKNVTNENPTDNPDIRYSLSEDNKQYYYRGQERTGDKIEFNSTNFIGDSEGGVYFTTDEKTVSTGKYGKHIIKLEKTPENTVSVEESDKLQEWATKQFEKDMQNGVESDYVIEQMALGRPRAFAEYTKKPFVETGDMFGEPNEAIYYEEVANGTSKYGVFDDDYSLSQQNEDIAPTGDYNVYGEDVKLQQAIAPLQEEIKELTESISELKEQIAPVQEKNAQNIENIVQNYTEIEYTQPSKAELDNLMALQETGGTEYANTFFGLRDKYGQRKLYKGIREYSKAPDTYEAPIKGDEFAPLTEADLPMLEQQYEQDFRNIDESSMPTEMEDNIPDSEMSEAKSLFETRDYEDVGNRKVNAYQYDNPEVKPYFQEAARSMLGDLKNSIKGEKGYNDKLYYESGGEEGFYGVSRQTTDDIAELLDGIGGKYKYTYADIEKGLNAIIKDEGSENNAVSKRIEFYLDQRLREGYTSIDGYEIPANQDYINLLKAKEFDDFYNSLTIDDSMMPVEEDIAPTNGTVDRNDGIRLKSINEITNDIKGKAPEEIAKYALNRYLEIEKLDRSLSEAKYRNSKGFYTQEALDLFTKRDIERLLLSDLITKKGKYEGSILEEINLSEEVANSQTQYVSNSNIAEKIAPVKEEYLAITPEKEPQLVRVKENPTYNEIAEILTEEPKTENDRNKRKWAIFKANVLDKGIVFEDLALKENNRELIAKWDYTLTSEARGQYAIGKGHNGSKSLDAIRQEVDNTGLTKDFYNYMYHKHNVDRMTLASRFEDMENKPVFGDSVTADVSQRIVNQYENQHPEFMDFAQDVYDYVNADKQLLVDNGVISQETADLWSKMYPHYVPTRRTTDTGIDINVPLDTMKTGINSPIKKATGGSADILPLFDTMAMRTLQTYRATAKNSFGVELMNTMGTTIESAETNVDEVIDSIDAQDGLLQEGKKGKNPTFTVFEDGEKITFEITKDMYDALKPVSESSLLSKTIKPLNIAGNIRRGLLTEYNPTFMLTNAIKDTQDILLNSQHSLKTYAKIPEAHKQLLTKGYWYQEYVRNGGEQNSYFDNESNTFKTENKSLAKKIALAPLNGISKLNNYVEMIPRLAEYIASRQSGRSIEVSMLDAARVTTNFKAGGAVTKWANRNGATFLNASVQGAMQQVRNIREAKANGVRGWVNLATKFTMAALPAVLLNNLVWEDDEEYEELSDYVKQNYYVVGKTDDGTFIRIPKGRAVAVIQEGINQMENLITGDDEADLRTFIELTINNLAPNNPLDNNILSPIVQVAQNKAWYGGDLVPTRLQDLPAAEQYDESTDEFSKWIGEIFNVSPYKVNYLLDQYSGGVGDVVLPMMTPEATSKAETIGEHLLAPFKSKFTTNSTMNNQNISDFYDISEELTTNAKKSDATDKDVLSNKYINSIKADMNELYKEKREIQNSDLSKKEKYEQVLDIQSQINDLAENALSEYSNVSSASNYSTVGDREYYKRINSEGETEWTKIDDELATDLEDLGLTRSEKNTYFKTKDEINSIDEESETKKAEIIEAIKGTGFNDEQKAYMYKKYYNTDTVDTIVSSGINIDAYFDYASKEFVADKDSSGKTISGSRKAKVIKYINGLDLSIPEKAILIKATNTFKFNDYNNQIVKYVSGLDISLDEKKAILEELDMKVLDDGRVIWE